MSKYFVNPKETLFLLCDIQENFRYGSPLFDDLLVNTQKLLTAGKILDIPLIVTEHDPKMWGKTVPNLDIAHAKAVLSKTTYSMITPEMVTKMKELYGGMPKNVVLFGVEAHICIDQTSIDLLSRNVNVFLVGDCLSSRSLQDRNLAIERLRAAGCVVVSIESVVYNLLRDCQHPKYPEIRQLLLPKAAEMHINK